MTAPVLRGCMKGSRAAAKVELDRIENKVKEGETTDRFCDESRVVDMGEEENQLRYLKHIDYEPEKLKNQHKIKIDDIEICFPMKPYQCQLDYMSKVVEACKKGQNALLESPTGTGKTLCLLTASLAWLK